MGQLLIRHLDDETKARLRRRAERHGRSMETEAREILRQGLAEEVPVSEAGLGTRIAQLMAGSGLTTEEHAALEVEIAALRRQPARLPGFGE